MHYEKTVFGSNAPFYEAYILLGAISGADVARPRASLGILRKEYTKALDEM